MAFFIFELYNLTRHNLRDKVRNLKLLKIDKDFKRVFYIMRTRTIKEGMISVEGKESEEIFRDYCGG
jgi:hypothetical protein